MTPDDIETKLFVVESAKYGDKYVEHLLEQYKTYVKSAEKVSEQRQKANEYFLAVNTGLVAVLGFVATKTDANTMAVILAFASVAGIVMCHLWYRIVLSYDGLNTGKYRVIHAIERRLPLALYDTEWDVLGRGEKKELYWPFSHIERRVPWIFICIYALLLISAMPWQATFNMVTRLVG